MKKYMYNMLASLLLVSSIFMVSCGEEILSTDSGYAEEESSMMKTVESEMTSEIILSEEEAEKKAHIQTYEIAEDEKGKNVILFTADAFENLEKVNSEEFTYDTIKEIVDNTIELYQNNDFITIPLKSGSELDDCVGFTRHGYVTISRPGDDDIYYEMGIMEGVEWKKYLDSACPLRVSDEEKIVFKVGKSIDEMEAIDKQILYEILWIRLCYSAGSNCYEYISYSGRRGGNAIIYLTNEADNYKDKKKLVFNLSKELYLFDAGVEYYEIEKGQGLIPECLASE